MSYPIIHKPDTWKIWFEIFQNGEKIGAGVWHQAYKRKSDATRRAKKHFGALNEESNGRHYIFTVSQTNPCVKEKE